MEKPPTVFFMPSSEPTMNERPKLNGLRVVDLFAGAGGTALGFVQAGYTILAAIEIDPDAAATYERNIGIRPVTQDIRKIDPVEFRRELGLEAGDLEVLVGCPPCQGFTRMRNDKGRDDPRNNLVEVYGEFVLAFRPRFVVFENVPGLLRTKHGKAHYEGLRRQLEKAGYAVLTRTVNAADFGVPQIRRRVIVLAGRDGEIPPDPLQARTHGPRNHPDVLKGKLQPWRTVEDEIAKYPALGPGETVTQMPDGTPLYNHTARKIGDRVLKFIKAVPKNGGSRTDVPEPLWLPCHRGHNGHKDVYGRLAWDRPANVITSGCTNVSKGRFVHPDQDRGLTPREAAALQGFPDDFCFIGGIDSISRQIGNAVPPPLAEAIARLLAERLLNGAG